MRINLFAVVLLAILPFTAEAQHGGGGSSRGGSSSAGAARNTGSVGASRSNNTARASRNNNQPRNQTIPRGSQPRNIQGRSSNRGGALTSRGASYNQPTSGLRGSYTATQTFYRRGFWPGGFAWGIWYGAGWYYFPGFYPMVWYYGPLGYGYQYSIGRPSDLSGIKFDLSQIPKDERKIVENGNVFVDGSNATLGPVKEFTGGGRKKILTLSAEDHDVVVRIKGGQEIKMSVAVQEGHVTDVALSFDQGRKDGQQSVSALPAKPDGPTLAPAPSPTDSRTN